MINTKMTQVQYAQLIASVGQGQAREIANALGGIKGARIKGGKGGYLLDALSNDDNRSEDEQKVLEMLTKLFELQNKINSSKSVTDAFYKHFPNFIEGFNLDYNWKDRSKQQ